MQIVKRSGVDRRSQLVLLERAFALIEEMKALKVLAGEGGRDVHCRCSASPMWDGMGCALACPGQQGKCRTRATPCCHAPAGAAAAAALTPLMPNLRLLSTC